MEKEDWRAAKMNNEACQFVAAREDFNTTCTSNQNILNEF
jgi:hypothetical protein